LEIDFEFEFYVEFVFNVVDKMQRIEIENESFAIYTVALLLALLLAIAIALLLATLSYG
jgi:hypothetical protein